MRLDGNLIMNNLQANTKEEVLKQLGKRLYEFGYVKKDFTKAILEREKRLPTGLPTKPYGIAIPHTDSDKVIQPKLAFASLKKPVTFLQMGNAKKDVEVKLIFMMALTDADDQLRMLQKLMGIFQNDKLVQALAQSRASCEIAYLIGLELGDNSLIK